LADTKIIDTTHAEYEDKLATWERYRLAYLANDEYYNTTINAFSSKEGSTQLAERKRQAYNALPVKNYISALQNHTWRKRFDYEYEANNQLVDDILQRNADGKFNSIFHFHANDILKWLPTYDTVWIYTAQHSFQGEITLAQQREQGLNPYFVLVSPENITNWKLKEDSQTEFSQVMMKTWEEVEDEYGFAAFQMRYLVFREDVIIKFDEEGEEVERYDNEIGKVPFVRLTIDESFISDIVRIAAAAVNLASGNLNFLNKSNFPILTQKGQEPLENFNAYADTGVFVGEDGEMKYLEYPTGSLDFNENTMKALQELADRAASQKYQSIATKMTQSGESQKENFKDIDAALAWINNTISEGLIQSVKYMGLYLGVGDVELSYSAPVTYLSESPNEVVVRAQNMLDIAADAKSVEMQAALSKVAYSPMLVGFEDKAQILEAEAKAIEDDKGMSEAMSSAEAEAVNLMQNIPSSAGTLDTPDEG